MAAAGEEDPGNRSGFRIMAALLAAAFIPLGLPPLTSLTPPARAAPSQSTSTVRWSVDPAAQSSVRTRDGALREFPPTELNSAIDTVTAKTGPPAAEVDVRGMRADGRWSEWLTATNGPAALPEQTRKVQVRLITGRAAPPVRTVELTGTSTGHPPRPRAGEIEFHLFATREGLVGGTTANGHIVGDRDHFVALPSRRGLAGRADGGYTVRVCTPDHGRCEWAPVWDVGPWNTTDDYWNPDRESWADLPRGVPQAQAAYLDGYHGGTDQFGRAVANPAGIDIADGMFWDGLRLDGSAWVLVRYEWTGSGPWGTVDADVLNVRAAPNSGSEQVGLAANRAQLRLECEVSGEHVDGPQGSSAAWYRVADGRFISRAYVNVGIGPPNC